MRKCKIKLTKATHSMYFITPFILLNIGVEYQSKPNMVITSFEFGWVKWGLVIHFIKPKGGFELS